MYDEQGVCMIPQFIYIPSMFREAEITEPCFAYAYQNYVNKPKHPFQRALTLARQSGKELQRGLDETCSNCAFSYISTSLVCFLLYPVTFHFTSVVESVVHKMKNHRLQCCQNNDCACYCAVFRGKNIIVRTSRLYC